jgi:hypothetical protein
LKSLVQAQGGYFPGGKIRAIASDQPGLMLCNKFLVQILFLFFFYFKAENIPVNARKFRDGKFPNISGTATLYPRMK